MSNSPAPATSYDPAFFETLYRAEDRHFWFRSRRRAIAAVARGIVEEFAPGYRVLEVGCGTGSVLAELERVCTGGKVMGMDLFSEGLEFARRRTGCELVAGDIFNPPFKEPFQLVCLFDVLEHLPDDAKALQSLNQLVAPGGYLFLTVPAHQSLWSYFDVAAHHCRRYKSAQLRERLEAAGFEVRFQSQFMTVLFPVLWLFRRLRPTPPKRDPRVMAQQEMAIVPGLNRVIYWLLAWEASWLARRGKLPIGTSIMAAAYKPPARSSA